MLIALALAALACKGHHCIGARRGRIVKALASTCIPRGL
ncbi:hypothetical protein PAMC26510_21265 [Caballeronia sordidicola]|uniref:Uncharacterized protein n=1 Tax=Caballeronia sordidicola TaxID=196367 RepID=A0A242MM10_CABSO|nr:hypothetical protein PAMC26510_21265 [Caballeronia sordidicola]